MAPTSRSGSPTSAASSPGSGRARTPARNRVTPTGAIEALDLRCQWLGNRGVLHRGREIVRPWRLPAWITCVTSYTAKSTGERWQLPQWAPNRFTVLFLYDEPVALAAGHRPCALCRRPAYNAFRDAWARAFDLRTPARAPEMDERLHADRLDTRAGDDHQRTHHRPWSTLPDGTFTTLGMVRGDRLHPWKPAGGYGRTIGRPTRGMATVLTPACTVEVLRAGYPVSFVSGAAGP